MKTSSSSAFVNQVLIHSLVAIGAGGSIGLGSVWMRHQISLTANANRAIEAKLAEVGRHGEEMRTAIAEAQDVSVLLRRNEAGEPKAPEVEKVEKIPRPRRLFSLILGGGRCRLWLGRLNRGILCWRGRLRPRLARERQPQVAYDLERCRRPLVALRLVLLLLVIVLPFQRLVT